MKEFYVSNKRHAKFAELDELRAEFGTEKLGEPFRSAGVPIYVDFESGEVLLQNKDVHTIIPSSSGSKKTISVIEPTLYFIGQAGLSAVVHDCKGEIRERTSKFFEDKGYRVITLNLREPRKSNAFDPFGDDAQKYTQGDYGAAEESIMDKAEVLKREIQSTKDVFWENSFTCYFTGLCLVLLKEIGRISFAELHRLHTQGEEKYTTEKNLNTYAKQIKEEDHKTYEYLECMINSASDTRASISTVFSNCLKRLTFNRDLCDMLSYSDFNVSELVDGKTIIYIISPEETTVYRSVLSIIIKSIYNQLLDIAYKSENNSLKNRVYFVLDEFSNLAPIPQMGAMLSAGRSRNILFILATQDNSQLVTLYGQEEAITIKSNCDALVYLHSPSYELRKELAQRSGERELPYSHKTVPLLSAEALSHLDKDTGEALLLLGRNYPYITHLPTIYDYAAKGYIKLGPAKLPVRKKRDDLPTFDLEEKLAGIFNEKLKKILDVSPPPNPKDEKKPEDEKEVFKLSFDLADMDEYLDGDDENWLNEQAELLNEVFNETGEEED